MFSFLSYWNWHYWFITWSNIAEHGFLIPLGKHSVWICQLSFPVIEQKIINVLLWCKKQHIYKKTARCQEIPSVDIKPSVAREIVITKEIERIRDQLLTFWYLLLKQSLAAQCQSTVSDINSITTVAYD